MQSLEQYLETDPGDLNVEGCSVAYDGLVILKHVKEETEVEVREHAKVFTFAADHWTYWLMSKALQKLILLLLRADGSHAPTVMAICQAHKHFVEHDASRPDTSPKCQRPLHILAVFASNNFEHFNRHDEFRRSSLFRLALNLLTQREAKLSIDSKQTDLEQENQKLKDELTALRAEFEQSSKGTEKDVPTNKKRRIEQ